MIGYHYASYENWKRIQQEGLVPYPLNHVEVFMAMGVKPVGIWVYEERQRGLSNLGCILWQQKTKNTSLVVLLAVQYDWWDELVPGLDQRVAVTHRLYEGEGGPKDFVWHQGAKVAVLFRPVPPERIRCVAEYDLAQMAETYDQQWNRHPAAELLALERVASRSGGRDERVRA